MKYILILIFGFIAAAAIYTLVIRFKWFFITLGILLAIAVIAYFVIKFRKKKDGTAIEQAPAPTTELTAGKTSTPAAEQITEQTSAPTAKPTAEPPKPETVVNTYEVAGVVFYLNNLLSMAEPNYLYDYKKQDLIDTCNYDVPIYKTVVNATRLELTHEPDNPHDPNAIMVLLDGKLVGYMPAKDCKHILDIMDNDLFVSATCKVYGGQYKIVNEEYDWEKDKSTYSMDRGQDEYSITVYIREKVLN